MNEKELVFFMGGKENVSIQLDDAADFKTVVHRLAEKLEAGAMLVAGNKLKLEVGGRVLGDEQKQALQKVFSTHGLPDPFDEAVSVSETPLEKEFEKADSVETIQEPKAETRDEEGLNIQDDTSNKAEDDAEKAESAAVEGAETSETEKESIKEEKPVPPEEKTLLVKKTLRSGQSVEYDGNVVIVGDVNPGAEVNAGGDILIMGTLRGAAHAGRDGEKKASIIALRFTSAQTRIASAAFEIIHSESAEPAPQILSIQSDKIKLEKLKKI